MKLTLTNFSLRHPWLVLIVVLLSTVWALFQFPKVTFDNDPENMLAEDEGVRVYHHRVKEAFSLYDFVVVGIVNEKHPDGVFNVGTLGRIDRLTRDLLSLHRSEDGKPAIVRPGDGAGPNRIQSMDLGPTGWWGQMLGRAFSHDPNNLFDAEGRSVIIGHELIGPGVVDNIKQADQGSLRIEFLMEHPPRTPAEARIIRDDAMSNPLYAGTLVSEDEKAICLYIPIVTKTYSYNVAELVRALTRDWTTEDRVYITGLPVAEDTFGVEMLVQMATSAPLAGLAIFLLMWFFFKRVSLIIAPMLVAIISVICTMGLLIGLGYDVHIMSSMIAIFLMPIAVADSVHILSEFFDAYHRFRDKAETVRHVIRHLFKPMLYTSLTTIAGFASLGTTPIPPVQVFGLHVAFGVALAWVLTMTLIPAYIMLAVRTRMLDAMQDCPVKPGECAVRSSWLNRTLESLGDVSYRRWRVIMALSLLVVALSITGIVRIRVNDNPVKWFTAGHSIRVADTVLNAHFGGTYTAYLTLEPAVVQVPDCHEQAAIMEREVKVRFGAIFPQATERFTTALRALEQQYRTMWSRDPNRCFVELVETAGQIDEEALASWNAMAETINYLDPESLTAAGLLEAVNRVAGVNAVDREILSGRLKSLTALTGESLQNAVLAVCDEYTGRSFREFVLDMRAELSAPLFKQPDMLRYVERLQEYLLSQPVVGKVSSSVDALKKAAYELNFVSIPAYAKPEERAVLDARNRASFAVPDTASAVGQVFTQLEGMKRKDALFHMVTRDYQRLNLWVQLKSGDNRDMESVVQAMNSFLAANPPPVALNCGWAGLTYLNVVWQEKMVTGMLYSLASSFVIVLVMMTVLFRSALFGLLAMIPLTVTILLIYGLIGWAGKDYDMPVAILSALTLGLSVDFAIHFLERAREETRRAGQWRAAVRQMFKEPAMAISRNASTVSVVFLPLLLAPLVPYRTVGFFLATIMAVSWLATLFLLPALLTAFQRWAFPQTGDTDVKTGESGDGSQPVGVKMEKGIIQ